MVAANWKMNLLPAEAEELFNALLVQKEWPKDVQILVFPPAVYLQHFSQVKDDRISVGIQNFFPKEAGAYTGEISVTQAKSCGAEYALIGHSERRAYFGEHSDFLKTKVDAALEHDVHPIFCCGEPLDIREANQEKAFVKQQLIDSLFHLTREEILKTTIAYEPVWAIGTGKTASVAQAEDMHQSIRDWLTENYSIEIANQISILYGGSCSPENAAELFACPNVDGGLIGGASLNAEAFSNIIKAF